MTEKTLISQIALKLDLPKTTVRQLFAELLKLALREFTKSGIFSLPGLGEFEPKLPAKGRARHEGDIKFKAASFSEASKKAKRAVKGRHSPYDVVLKKDIKVRRPFQFKVKDATRFASVDHILLDSGGGHVGGDGGGNGDANGGGLPGTPVAEVEVEATHSVVRIFYGTDREPTSKDPLRYGSRRSSSDKLYLGTCDVSIPRDHRMGSIERPSILRLEFRQNPDKHFVIQQITLKTNDDFYAELSERVGQSKKKEAFVFIHGFKVAFNDAVYRTAQMAYDLGFAGAPVLYSWPSNGRLFEYTGDINNNDWTVDHLKEFLQELRSRSGAEVIHLIAHSMGNRALLNALRLLIESKPTPVPHFNQIILTAPDIDADLFKRIAKIIQGSAERITLYASNHDKALAASKKINASYPRAGDCSDSVVVLSGVDTIDASAVDTNLIGHFYYAENRSVLSDVFNLLRDGGPLPRFGIRPVEVTPPYWRFVP